MKMNTMTDTSTPRALEFQACSTKWTHCMLRSKKAAQEMRNTCAVLKLYGKGIAKSKDDYDQGYVQGVEDYRKAILKVKPNEV